MALFRHFGEMKSPPGWNPEGSRGADGNRNHDLFDANEALYQLSYSPVSGDCSSRQLTKV